MKRSILLIGLVVITWLLPLSVQSSEMTSLTEQARRSIEPLNLELPAFFPRLKELPVIERSVDPPAVIAPWPTQGWSTSTPEEQGMDRQMLIDAFRYAIGKQSKAVVVIRNGYLVVEWYGDGWNQNTRQQAFSVSKSVSSALVGMLVDEGLITDVNQSASDFISEWQGDQHQAITIGNLIKMDSGLQHNFLTDALLVASADQTQFAINLDVEDAPGDVWVYHNAACQSLSEVIFRASGMQAEDYARGNLFEVIGMWNTGWETDRVGNTLTYMGVVSSAQELAKFGYLFLRNGNWDGTQVISQEWVQDSTRPSQLRNPFYGYLWWLNTLQVMPDVPGDAYAAMGLNERRIYVVPSLDLVVVRLGSGEPSWSDNTFLGLVSGSVIGQ